MIFFNKINLKYAPFPRKHLDCYFNIHYQKIIYHTSISFHKQSVLKHKKMLHKYLILSIQ